MKPTPMAAPTVPSAFARFSGALISDAYANAAEIFPAMKPASMRDASSHHRLSAKPSIAYDTHAPARLDMRIGRRPYSIAQPSPERRRDELAQRIRAENRRDDLR